MTAIVRQHPLAALLVLVLLNIPLLSQAAVLPKNRPVPGGVALLKIDRPPNVSVDKPSATYNDKPVMLIADPKKPGRWTAVTGISLETEPGTQELLVKWGERSETIKFKVKKHKYKTQYITLKNKKKVDLSDEDFARYKREKEQIVAALQHWSDSPALTQRFILPVTGRMSGEFGKRRFFNKKPRKAHSGIDIAAPHGTPILSPLDGTIIDTGDYFFNGNSIFIDHGQGLITMYCHMSKVDVKVGDKVKQGQRIGAIGKTGRATGPHLHWAISINDTRVDPGLFFKNIKKAIRKKRRYK